MFDNITLNLSISVAHIIHYWPTLSVLQSLGGNLEDFIWHLMLNLYLVSFHSEPYT